MTTPAASVPNYLTGAGFLLWAPLASTEPTNTVIGSVFTDTWDAAWVNLGATNEGSEFTSSIEVEPIEVAEYSEAIAWVATGRESGIKFNLANYTAANLKKVLNGGTLTVTGSTTTTKSVYTPPALGSEVRCMIGWESLDRTVRLVGYQSINSGDVSMTFDKAPSFTTMPCEFKFEVPSSGIPFKIITAGASR